MPSNRGRRQRRNRRRLAESKKQNSIAVKAVADKLPFDVLEIIFSFLELSDLGNCASVCKSWYYALEEENNLAWKKQCLEKAPSRLIYSRLMVNVPSFKAKLRCFYHAWNPLDCSDNIYIKNNGFTLHRRPYPRTTDVCRGKIGFNNGRHVWDVKFHRPLGTTTILGVATKEAPLQCRNYTGLLGSDANGWGWNLVSNRLHHKSVQRGRYPLTQIPPFEVGDCIRVILDCDKRTLAFEKNNRFLGIAFRGLPRKRLYPAIDAVWGDAEISMIYLGRIR